MRRIVYFAGGDNWEFSKIMRHRFSADFFVAVKADDDPNTLYKALAEAAPVDLLIIGTHGAHADFLLIEGTRENRTECSVSYRGRSRTDIHPADFGQKIKKCLSANAKISIISCSVAGGDHGKTLVMALSCTSGALVYAADKEVLVEVIGSEGAAVKVTGGGEVWGSKSGAYPQPVGRRGRYPFD